jgi:predicted flavoprotein YhiN
LMISQEGIEGGAIYALSRFMREAPGQPLQIDLRPDVTAAALTEKLAKPRGKESLSTYLRKTVGLTPVAISLLHETKTPVTAEGIKDVAVNILRPAGIARAISSAGGVARSEVNGNFQFLKFPNCYAVGEMLDWEAPTGGYLLQACLSTAFAAAQNCLENLQKP